MKKRKPESFSTRVAVTLILLANFTHLGGAINSVSSGCTMEQTKFDTFCNQTLLGCNGGIGRKLISPVVKKENGKKKYSVQVLTFPSNPSYYFYDEGNLQQQLQNASNSSSPSERASACAMYDFITKEGGISLKEESESYILGEYFYYGRLNGTQYDTIVPNKFMCQDQVHPVLLCDNHGQYNFQMNPKPPQCCWQTKMQSRKNYPSNKRSKISKKQNRKNRYR